MPGLRGAAPEKKPPSPGRRREGALGKGEAPSCRGLPGARYCRKSVRSRNLERIVPRRCPELPSNPSGRPKVVAEVKELAREHTGKAIETLVSIMTNLKSAPAARVSEANALLDRGYGKPPQHITGEGGPSYVVRLPEPCKTAEEWVASLGDRSAQTTSNGSIASTKSRGSA